METVLIALCLFGIVLFLPGVWETIQEINLLALLVFLSIY